MSAYPAPWALCGGWAVDAWAGRPTREHPDVDISVFVQDQQALFDHLTGWQLIAHDPHVPGDTSEPWNGRPLVLPAHIHAGLAAGEGLPDHLEDPARQGFGLDIQLDNRDGDAWLLSREPRISIPLRDGVAPSPWGLPAVVPEVLLFFKGRGPRIRLRDEIDFAALLPLLTREQRDWLHGALSASGHPWLPRLET